MNETKEKTVPVRKTSPGPAGLEGVNIAGCAFTESVGKKEPRPPLFYGPNSGNVILKHEGRIVYVAIGNRPDSGMPSAWIRSHGILAPYLGFVTSISRMTDNSIPYTGPITPAMWQIINRWWNP